MLEEVLEQYLEVPAGLAASSGVQDSAGSRGGVGVATFCPVVCSCPSSWLRSWELPFAPTSQAWGQGSLPLK